MRSTFHGLETARRALFTQQTALHTTGHNIANANTPGFSRQRVNFLTTEPFPKPGMNKPGIPGQLGTGVKAGAIQRVREGYLDAQYRTETSKFGYWDARQTALYKIEDIMNEPTEDGIANTLDRFWRSLQDLSVHPEDSGARSVVRQNGIAVAETFSYTASTLKTNQRDLKSQIDINVNQINSLTRQINDLNIQISKVEPHGYLPNDLYDQRDVLIDQLSQLANIKVEQVNSGGQALEIAEGKYTVKLVDANGRDLGVTLVDGRRLETNEMRINYDDITGLVRDIYFASPKTLAATNFDTQSSSGVVSFNAEQFRSIGKMKADIEAYGFMIGDQQKGLYPEILRNLDQMVYTFVHEFNKVHSAGWNLNDIKAGVKGEGISFFDYGGIELTSTNFQGAASLLKVSAPILDKLDNIAASQKGDGVYGRMEDEDGNLGPSISGIYTPGGADTDEKYLFVRYSDDPGQERWQYVLSNQEDLSLIDPSDWINFDETDPSVTTIVVNGLTINASGMDQDKDWKFNQPLVPGIQVEGFAGDGSNALALANVKDANLSFGGTTTNVQSFYQGVIGDMAVSTNEAERMARNSDTLRISVDQRREAVSGVSLDEEMTNLIQFQHAYNAAARTITMVDEMLDKIINGMGLVGR